MNTEDWLKKSTASLSRTSTTPALDARLLLSHVLNVESSSLLLIDPKRPLDRSHQIAADGYLKERLAGKPISQIVGFKEFYGRKFIVNGDTLAPRPESEIIVERAIELIHKGYIKSVSDIGTGSGCLIVSVAAETIQDGITFLGCDNSTDALKIAKLNAREFADESKIAFVEADIYHPSASLSHCLDAQLIIANLPYVPEDYPINRDATFDPHEALFSGSDGLDHYRQLFSIVDRDKTKTILVEHLPIQRQELRQLAKITLDAKITNVSDLVTQLEL